MSHYIDSINSEGLTNTKSFRTQALVTDTSASTIVMSVSSEMLTIFTGTVAGQIINLPDATTINTGHRYEIHNNSTADVTLNDSTGTTLVILTTRQRALAALQVATTPAGTWSIVQSELAAGLTSGSTTSFFNDFFYDDFVHSQIVTELLNGGTAIVEATPVDNTYTGAFTLNTGTTVPSLTTMGKTAAVIGVNSNFKAGSQTLEWRMRLTTLSGSSNLVPRYDIKVGVQDTVLAAMGDPANGIYIQYSDNINSGQFIGVTRNASTSTVVNSSIAVATNTWYRLKFIVNSIGTSVSFYVNDILIGTSTTNIPTTNPVRIQSTIEKKSFNAKTFLPAAVNTTSETITIASHGFINTDRVVFTTTGTLPAPLSAATIYFVVGSTTNTFQVSTSSGGGAVNLSSTGSGTHTVSQVSGTSSTSLWDWYSYSVTRT